jgi:hypothetical protein
MKRERENINKWTEKLKEKRKNHSSRGPLLPRQYDYDVIGCVCVAKAIVVGVAWGGGCPSWCRSTHSTAVAPLLKED